MLQSTFFQADAMLFIACKILIRSTEWGPMQIHKMQRIISHNGMVYALELQDLASLIKI